MFTLFNTRDPSHSENCFFQFVTNWNNSTILRSFLSKNASCADEIPHKAWKPFSGLQINLIKVSLIDLFSDYWMAFRLSVFHQLKRPKQWHFTRQIAFYKNYWLIVLFSFYRWQLPFKAYFWEAISHISTCKYLTTPTLGISLVHIKLFISYRDVLKPLIG